MEENQSFKGPFVTSVNHQLYLLVFPKMCIAHSDPAGLGDWRGGSSAGGAKLSGEGLDGRTVASRWAMGHCHPVPKKRGGAIGAGGRGSFRQSISLFQSKENPAGNFSQKWCVSVNMRIKLFWLTSSWSQNFDFYLKNTPPQNLKSHWEVN